MEENKREMPIDLTELTRKVYNKIALWNNGDGSSEQKGKELRFVSHEIIEMVLSDAFQQLDGVKTKVKVVPGEETNKKKKGGFKNIFNKKKRD